MDGVSAASAIASLIILSGKITVQAHGFFGKVKDCPKRVKNIETDLRSTTSILQKLEKAFKEAEFGVYRRDEFKDAIEGLEEIFKELEELMAKYDGLGFFKKVKWASTGLDEATQLGRLLAGQKQNLTFMLQLTQSETLLAIRSGVVNNSDELRILMSQVHGMRANGTGATDPRLDTWFESVAEYGGTASVSGTVPESYDGGASPTESSRSLSDVTIVEVNSEVTNNNEDIRQQNADHDLHLPAIVYRCTQYLSYVAPHSWNQIPWWQYRTLSVQESNRYRDTLYNLARIRELVAAGLRGERYCAETSVLRNIEHAVAALPSALSHGKRGCAYSTAHAAQKTLNCRECLERLPLVADAASQGRLEQKEIALALGHYSDITAFLQPMSILDLRDKHLRTRSDESNDISIDLWTKFIVLRDLDLLKFDWSTYGPIPPTPYCVGDLFIQYLLKDQSPIIPASIGNEFQSPRPPYLFIGLKNALRGQLLENSKLLLYYLLSFLNDISLKAENPRLGAILLANAFYKVIGVNYVYTLHLIQKLHTILIPPYQDSDENTFSFNYPFIPKIPMLSDLQDPQAPVETPRLFRIPSADFRTRGDTPPPAPISWNVEL